MTDSDPDEVLRQLAGIQRELRRVRWLLVIVSATLALLLFAPSWVALLAELESSLLSFVLPIGGFVALIVIAAAVVSHFSPSQPTPRTTAVSSNEGPGQTPPWNGDVQNQHKVTSASADGGL